MQPGLGATERVGRSRDRRGPTPAPGARRGLHDCIGALGRGPQGPSPSQPRPPPAASARRRVRTLPDTTGGSPARRPSRRHLRRDPPDRPRHRRRQAAGSSTAGPDPARGRVSHTAADPPPAGQAAAGRAQLDAGPSTPRRHGRWPRRRGCRRMGRTTATTRPHRDASTVAPSDAASDIRPLATRCPDPEDSASEATAVTVDLDGDGCPESVSVDGRTVQVASTQFELGVAGDLAGVTDDGCDGSGKLVLLRPSTGELFEFAELAGPDSPVEGRLRAVVPGAVALRPPNAPRDRAPAASCTSSAPTMSTSDPRPDLPVEPGPAGPSEDTSMLHDRTTRSTAQRPRPVAPAILSVAALAALVVALSIRDRVAPPPPLGNPDRLSSWWSAGEAIDLVAGVAGLTVVVILSYLTLVGALSTFAALAPGTKLPRVARACMPRVLGAVLAGTVALTPTSMAAAVNGPTPGGPPGPGAGATMRMIDQTRDNADRRTSGTIQTPAAAGDQRTWLPWADAALARQRCGPGPSGRRPTGAAADRRSVHAARRAGEVGSEPRHVAAHPDPYRVRRVARDPWPLPRPTRRSPVVDS